MKKEIIVSKELEGLRLDKFLAKEIGFLSRTKINNLIETGAVTVDEKVKKPSFHLRAEQLIFVDIQEEKNELKPYEFKVNIIHEDDDIVIVNKQTGLVVHPPQKNYRKTLVNALLYLKKDLSNKNSLRPGVVHRLDKETSGVMVLAKNDYSHNSLVAQFKERKVQKKYAAIVWGEFKRKNAVVDLPLTRDSKNRLKMKVSFLKSKTARTEIEVISKMEKSTYLEIIPVTGRMHQIRVHLNFLGFPIVGDKKYGVKDGYEQLFLHASKLIFNHPRSGKRLTFKASIPDRFKEFIKENSLKNN